MLGVRRASAILGALVAACVLGPLAVAAGKSTSRPKPVNPFQTPAMRAFLHSRGGNVTAAVENLWTGRLYLYRPGVREHTASIVKMDILETLLRQHQLRHTRLSPSEAATATGMIEHSDNNDATALWNEVGGPGGVGAYNRRAGLTQTIPNGAWGLTLTTPLDQVRLLRELVLHPALLDPGAQRYELDLMHRVESDQRWGVSGGVPARADIALKNGWLPYGGGWQINSVGRIKGLGRDYLIAVMTQHDPSMGYGIGTIQGISAIVWRELAEREAGHWGTGVPSAASTAAAAQAAARAGERMRADPANG